jgi:predicted dehydrogenase
LADSKGLHLLIGYGWNYLPCVREAKRMMDEVGIGEIEQSSLRMTSVTRELLANLAAYPAAAPETAPDQATWTDPRNGGGYGQAQLTHALGLALWITGLRGDAVFAFMRALMNAPVEHHDAVTIRYSNGSVGTMAGGSSHLGANDNQGQLEFRAIGALGEFAIDLGQDYVSLWRADGYGYTPSLSKGAFRYDCAGPPHALVDLALGKDVENCSPGELGARAVEILEAAYRSAVSGRVEQVSRTAEALSARDSSEPEAA